MKITSPAEAFRFFRKRMQTEVEEFWAVALNSDKGVIASACLFRGTADQCLFHPRDVFRFAYRANAVSMIVAHNHPSGNALPSPEDRRVTQQLSAAGDFLQVPVDDHIIVAGKSYFSFLEAGELSPRRPVADLLPDDR